MQGICMFVWDMCGIPYICMAKYMLMTAANFKAGRMKSLALQASFKKWIGPNLLLTLHTQLRINFHPP